jgi:hypothetical protein
LVSAVLKTLDIDTALAEAKVRPAGSFAAASLPPVIKVLSPQQGAVVTASPITVRYLLRAPSGERVKAIDARLDGRPLPGGQGVVRLENGPAAQQEGTIMVPIDHDATITLVARAGERQSEGANLRLAWKPPPAASAPQAAPKPKLYVLAVGVSSYKDAELQLHYQLRTRAASRRPGRRSRAGSTARSRCHILSDEQATREAILDGLDWIEQQTTARDVALVLLAGHGDNDGDGAY